MTVKKLLKFLGIVIGLALIGFAIWIDRGEDGQDFMSPPTSEQDIFRITEEQRKSILQNRENGNPLSRIFVLDPEKKISPEDRFLFEETFRGAPQARIPVIVYLQEFLLSPDDAQKGVLRIVVDSLTPDEFTVEKEYTNTKTFEGLMSKKGYEQLPQDSFVREILLRREPKGNIVPLSN